MNIWSKFTFAIAHEFYNLCDYIFRKSNNIIPGIAEDIDLWEKELEIDEAYAYLTDDDDKRYALHALFLTSYTGMNEAVYYDFAEKLGSKIKIVVVGATVQAPFRVNYNRVDRTPLEKMDGARLWSKNFGNKIIIYILRNDRWKKYLQKKFDILLPAHLQVIWVDVDNL